MDFNEYQKKSQDTWIFNEKGFIRVILGICGESGEIAEKIKKHYRGDTSLYLREEMTKELGDLLYYIARCADYMELNLEDIAKFNIEKLKSRKERNKIKGSGDER
jgi:NTP pyrophosphatase (non-canonical NTP hydrolase)